MQIITATSQEIICSMNELAASPELRKRIEDEYNNDPSGEFWCKISPNGMISLGCRKIHISSEINNDIR